MFKKMMSSAAFLALLASPAAADSVKIGFVTTLTTPAAVIGKDMRDAVDLAVEHLGGKIGDKDIEIVYADDEFNSQKGKQATERLVLRDEVDIVAGHIWSNVLMASAPVVLGEGKILISANAGPAPLAGAQCNPNFFNIAWQNDQTPMALGELLNQQGVKSLYLVAPNYAAGQNMVAGVERTFKGEIVGKDMTVWPSQRDWSRGTDQGQGGETRWCLHLLSGAGRPGLHQAVPAGGSCRRSAALFGLYAGSDQPAAVPEGGDGIGAGHQDGAVLGARSGQCGQQEVRRDFRAKYGRYPSFYAAQSYDAINYIAAAVAAVDGDISNTDGMRAALKAANFDSVRGTFKMGNNNFPIQNFYERTVVEDADGNWTTAVGRAVLTDHQDPYASQCKMPG